MKTKEPQYNNVFKIKKKFGITKLGMMANQVWIDDPKHFLFSLSRYKFVSKIFHNFKNVLEIGCGDGFYSTVVKQSVKKLTCIDFDPVFINDAKEKNNKKWKIKFVEHNIIKKKFKGLYDGVYSLDVFEHIKKKNEKTFIKNSISGLRKNGVYILGIPSLESQRYASKTSKLGHVNCKSGNDFQKLLKKFFHNVFLFSMNDEVVHTGFVKMAHYIICICCVKK